MFFYLIYTRLMLLRCWFVKLDLQYYHIMVCRNTELQYSVIQLLRKYHIDHCLSLVMLSLWCYFYVHFKSFSESSSCFHVHFQSFSESSSCFYVHFQSVSESSSCFLCTSYICSHAVSHRPVLRNFMMTCWRLWL